MGITRVFLLISIMASFSWGGVCPLVRANVAAPPEILYLSSGSGDIALDLEPTDTEGFFFTGCEALTTVEVDGRQVPHNITLDGGDRAIATAPFSGLEDGRHKAAAESPWSVEQGPSRREVLFVVDTEPPELELIEPETGELQPNQTTFLVRCRDTVAGVSPDPGASGLSITINDNETAWELTEADGDLFFLVYCVTPQWEPDQVVRLHMSLKDRAGNLADLNRSFNVEVHEDEWDLETVNCVEGDGRTEGLYVLRRIPFPLRTSIHWIGFDAANRSMTLPMELSTLQGLPLDPGIYDALEIVGNHPCLHVDRLQRAPSGSAVDFRVSQVSMPEYNDCLGSITIKYPESVVFDYELGCPEGEPGIIGSVMTAEGPMKSYNVPVSLYGEGGGYSDKVLFQDGHLVYQITLTDSGGLDTSNSWFEMEGTREWLTEVAQGVYEASVPVIREGLYVYTTRLALSGLSEWGDVREGEVIDGGRSLLKTGDFFLELDPPLIDHFHYDRENECFRAMVSDQGTSPEDLVMELVVSGIGGLDPGFDPAAGTVEASFPMPAGVQAGLLKVTDLAGQTTTAVCQAFGTTPPSLPLEGHHTEYPATVKEASRSGSVRPSGDSSGLKSRQYLGQYKDGKQAVVECIKTAVPVTKEHPLTICLKAAHARFGTVTAPGNEQGSSLKMTSPPAPEPNPALALAEKECRDKYPPGTRHTWKYEYTEECRKIWVDTLPPRIRDVTFLPAGRRVTALIDDHGMPLSDLRIGYYITQDPHINPYSRIGNAFTFDTVTGLFVGEASLLNETEIFKVEIKATDAAGNWSNNWLEVTAPVSPPDVSLEILRKGPVAFPWGTCYDRSGIDHRKTRAWLDGRRINPVGLRYGQWAAGPSTDQVEFGPVTEEGPHMALLDVTDFAGLSSEASAAFSVSIPPKIENFRHLPTTLQNAGGPAFSAFIHDSGKDLYLEGIELAVDGAAVDRDRLYYDPRTGYFAADGPMDLCPGMHLARLTARDAHGNSDEAFLSFVPGERIHIHGKDRGDLSIEEVTLWELQEHNGDGKANPGETIRLFVSLTNYGARKLTAVSGRLESHEPGIVVERDEASFGDLEQGRTLTPMHGFDIRIDEGFLETTFTDPYEAGFTLEAVDETGKTWLLDFSVPVYRATLPFLVQPASPSRGKTDPADPDSILISEVIVTLDTLPPNTEETAIEVAGKAVSTASLIDEVMVRVNGAMHAPDWNPVDGSFVVTVNLDLGDNLIEAEAVDLTGAMGMDMGFVHRTAPYVPPDIRITEPADGADLELDPGFLLGNFDPGSSAVANIQASMTAEGETVSFPIGYSSSEGAFWAGGGAPENLIVYFRPNWGFPTRTTIVLTVILTTTDGDTVEDTVTFTFFIPH